MPSTCPTPRFTTTALPDSDGPGLSPSSSSSSLSESGISTPAESNDSELLDEPTPSHVVGLGLDIALERLAEAGNAFYANAQKTAFPRQAASSIYADEPHFDDFHSGPHSPIHATYISEWQQNVSTTSALWSDPDSQYVTFAKPPTRSPALQLAWQLDQVAGTPPTSFDKRAAPVQEEEEDEAGDDELSDDEVECLLRTSRDLRSRKRASQSIIFEEARSNSLSLFLPEEANFADEWHAGFIEWRRKPSNPVAVLRRDWRVAQLVQGLEIDTIDSIHDRVVQGQDMPLRLALGVASVLQAVETHRKRGRSSHSSYLMQAGLSSCSFA